MSNPTARDRIYERMSAHFGVDPSTCEDAFNEVLKIMAQRDDAQLQAMLNELIASYGEPEGSGLPDLNPLTMHAVLLTALQSYWSPHENIERLRGSP